MSILFDSLLLSHTFKIVLIGSIFLGITSGVLGAFATLRKQSLIGDAIAHASLPGITVMFLFTQTKNTLLLLIGATIAGWLGTLFISLITNYSPIKKDAALGITLSSFFGLGIVFLTVIQKLPTASKSGLDSFLFGNASTLLYNDIVIIGTLSLINITIVILCWKEFKLISFDPSFASSIGLSTKKIDTLLTLLIVTTIVIGLQTVGTILISTLIIAPAAAARQWTDKLGNMVIIASIFGMIAGTGGSIISSQFTKVPTGPTIVLIASFIVLISLLFAPNRGIIWEKIHRILNKKTIQAETLLQKLYYLALSHKDKTYAHHISSLMAIENKHIETPLLRLKKQKLVHSPKKDHWGLTEPGIKYAKTLIEKANK